jgi:hypothetical protein
MPSSILSGLGILQKSLAVETLKPDETATLFNVEDEGLWKEMFETVVG